MGALSTHPTRGSIKAWILWTLVLLLLTALIAWVFFLPKIVSSVVERRTGFHLQVERLSCNPFSAHFDLAGLNLSNPQSFPNPDFVKVRALEVSLPISSLWADTFVVDRVVVDIEEVALIKAPSGDANALLFSQRLKGPDAATPAQASSTTASGPSQPSKPFLIHHMELRLSTIVVENHTSRDPLKKRFALNFSQKWSEVSNVKQLLNVNVLRALAPVAAVMNDQLPPSFSKAYESISSGGKDLLKLLGNDFFKTSGGVLEQNQKP